MIHYHLKSFDELTAQELYYILKLRQDVFVIEQQCIYEDCDMKDLNAFHLFGVDEKSLVSYCRILPAGLSYENYCAIGRVVTTHNVRKMGLGKQLMDKAIECCTLKFKEDIKISAQYHLEKFYNGLGFQTVSEVYLEDDIPHVAMLRKQKIAEK